MTALAQDRGTLKKVPVRRTLEAAGTIYVGALVAVNSSGKAVAASDAAGLKVIGCAQNAAIATENVTVEEGCFAYDGTGITNADIGKTVYVADDQTVSLSAGTNGVIAGTVFDVDTEGVWVAIGRTAQGVYQTPLSKAASSDITAGTDDAMYATPKGLKDAGIVAVAAATTAAAGKVKMAATVAAAAGETTTGAEFNALRTSLINSGALSAT